MFGKKKSILEYRCDRGEVIDKMRDMLDRAAAENRDLTDAEIADYEALEAKQEKIGAHVERMEKGDRLNYEMDQPISESKPIHLAGQEYANNQPKRIIPANESFADATGVPRLPNGITLGGVLRGMAGAGMTPEIRNALSIGTDAAGGYTVPTALMAELIDALRAKSVCNAAGCQTVTLDTQQTNVARMDTDPVASWRAEAASVAESDPTFTNVQFNAKSLAVLVKVSVELLQDSINVEQALMNAFAQSLALTLDSAALYGTGASNQPTGIINTTGINTVSMGANGAALTGYGDLVDAYYELAADNAGPPSAAIMAPRTLAEYAKLVDGNSQPLQKPDLVSGLPFHTTTNMPVDETQGTATDASSIIVGDFSQLWIGIRQQLRIELLKEHYMENLQIGFIAHLRADIALAHPQSFCRIQGVIPA
ncbi:MAG: phage major capsid protein [gamma proteobacterium endosymbiont of Lamellibrachia anaximandri]|nr:phage major capsid protein [gamma proteobacterium endosymbiont of Lamellibrachia anaximandri]MBL3535255.1 phage major capsid protein [gamma proteobacterium endosymbiont of Lamellibrachia anaximandri]